jgi:hypothetical protein
MTPPVGSAKGQLNAVECTLLPKCTLLPRRLHVQSDDSWVRKMRRPCSPVRVPRQRFRQYGTGESYGLCAIGQKEKSMTARSHGAEAPLCHLRAN